MTRQWCRRSVGKLAAGLAVGALASSRAGAASAVRYTMTAFTNDSDSDLAVYESDDGVTFSLLRARAYRPPSGLVRDPSLIRHTDGAYYLAYTTAGDGNTIGFARSADRVGWDHLYDYPIPVPGTVAAWAPTWFVDPSGRVHVVVSLSNDRFFLPYVLSATDASLRSWSPPRPLTDFLPKPGEIGYIDTTIVFDGGRYHAFAKNESTKFVELAVADDPLGPYRLVRTGDWAGWGAPREGQCLIRLPDGGWRIYLDAYADRTYLYSDSHDEFRTWTTPVELPGVSGTIRHVTVLPEHP